MKTAVIIRLFSAGFNQISFIAIHETLQAFATWKSLVACLDLLMVHDAIFFPSNFLYLF